MVGFYFKEDIHLVYVNFGDIVSACQKNIVAYHSHSFCEVSNEIWNLVIVVR